MVHVLADYGKIMKKVIPISLAFMLASCVSPVSVELHNEADGKPVAGALLQRNRKPNWFARAVNPVGAFYHRYWTVESVVTDKDGQAEFKRIAEDDEYYVVIADRTTVRAQLGGHSVTLRPCEEFYSEYLYHIRPQEQWTYSVSKPWFNVDQQKAQAEP